MLEEGIIEKRRFLQRHLIYVFLVLCNVFCMAFAAHLPDSVVYPRLIDSRSGDNNKVLYVRPGLSFNLEPAAILGDTITLITDDDHTEKVNTDIWKEHLYQDTEMSASLYVEERNDGVFVEGALGNELRIRPLPTVRPRQDQGIPHKIFLVEDTAVYNGDIVELDSAYLEPEPSLTERSAELPDAVYVNISILVDSVLTKGLNKLNISILGYVAVFLNGVNLRYAQLKNPKFQVKLRLVKILSELNEAECLNISGPVLDFGAVLNEFRMFVARQDFNDSAVVFMMSGRDVAGGAGRAAVGSALAAQLCTAWRFGVGEDIPGTYKGIPTSAHEILHIVGAVHDGSPPRNNKTGEPGARKCPSGKHIMSGFASTQSSNWLSNCTQEQVTFFLKRKGPSCWKPLNGNLSELKLTLSRLPGTNISASAFCALANPTKYTGGKIDADCRINCTTTRNKSEYFVGLDGMECPNDKDKVCIKGKCIPTSEIPLTLPHQLKKLRLELEMKANASAHCKN